MMRQGRAQIKLCSAFTVGDRGCASKLIHTIFGWTTTSISVENFLIYGKFLEWVRQTGRRNRGEYFIGTEGNYADCINFLKLYSQTSNRVSSHTWNLSFSFNFPSLSLWYCYRAGIRSWLVVPLWRNFGGGGSFPATRLVNVDAIRQVNNNIGK